MSGWANLYFSKSRCTSLIFILLHNLFFINWWLCRVMHRRFLLRFHIWWLDILNYRWLIWSDSRHNLRLNRIACLIARGIKTMGSLWLTYLGSLIESLLSILLRCVDCIIFIGNSRLRLACLIQLLNKWCLCFWWQCGICWRLTSIRGKFRLGRSMVRRSYHTLTFPG